MKIRIRLHIEFDPSLHLNAYGPVIVAKLPTPTITDQCSNSYVIYNYWTLDELIINLELYLIFIEFSMWIFGT